MATMAVNTTQRRCWSATPEVWFAKGIDNSRLVKVADRKRQREMRQFTVALVIVATVLIFYVWQHFRAIEYGYRIEELKGQHEVLLEQNRQLKLEEASLRSPERIVALAEQMGLTTPQVGQVVPLDNPPAEHGGAVVAQVATVTVVSPN